jgi:hypothetical protein
MVMTVVEAVERDIELLGPKAAESGLAATALALAQGMDGPNSLTSKSMAAKALIDTMRELRVLVPPKQEADGVTDIATRREARRAAPRLLHVPEFVSSTGEEACELAAMAGLEMDPWQQFVLTNALGEQPGGLWAAKEVGVEVPRQNGKGGILEARALAGLFLLGERQIIHSAHEFATAEEALNRMEHSSRTARSWARVKTIKHSHGQEGIYLKNGQRLRYKTRTKGGGRGFSADCVILDEAMVIPEEMHGALLPTLSAMPNPQLWYTGSAVDQESMEHGVVFARLRERAIRGEATRASRISGGHRRLSTPTRCPRSLPRLIRTCGRRRTRRSGSGSRPSMSRWRASRWTRGRSRSSGSASATGRRPGPRARSSTSSTG